MKYLIKHGNIASIIKVNDQSFCYIKPGFICDPLHASEKGIRIFEQLPDKVKNTVKGMFEEVFTLPLNDRGNYIKQAKEITL